MRSTRMLLAAAAAAAVVGIAAPGAQAADGDWGQKSSDSHESSSYGKEKEHDKDGKHDKPYGGMHTGGGALTVADDEEWGTAKDPKHDPETYKDSSDSGYSKGDHSKGDYGKGDHDKPRGGMHTGGGALASPGVTAGGLAVLAVAGTGLYAVRRNRSAGNVA
ncbi:hypothetical protein OG252_06145 [Streptomyces sp. NBC_01352]|uniref:hypothetical protein n=1 Tax=Streptomyces sp. NBC_01352 TaxID=2903834 RepID=UPI002E329386|nr:hypothetical protein [Streptomyces sp. NBC_01352]